MAKLAKRIQKIREGIDATKLYALTEAVSLVKDRAVAKFGEGAFGQIKNAAWSRQVIGVGLLIERVCSGRLGGELAVVGKGLEHE